MRSYQQSLIQLIVQPNVDLNGEQLLHVKALPAKELASVFVELAYLLIGLQFLQEQYWLQNKELDREINFPNFVKKFIKAELRPLLFLHSSLEKSSIEELAVFKKNTLIVQKTVLECAKLLPYPHNKDFAQSVMKLISELFEFEYQLVLNKKNQNQYLGFSLYRAFDMLDDFFNLDYATELTGQLQPVSGERLYEGSGVAVQSSYMAIHLALRYLRIPTGSRFVDLGSGFGRVGLVVGLLRPDIQFTGYELVQQRVDMASAASQSLGMEQQVHFYAQDLAAVDFVIPDAETYYLYDPFSESTYRHVVAQLNKIASRKKINVITKGNAKLYFQEPGQRSHWSRPQEFESGSFCLFRSNF